MLLVDEVSKCAINWQLTSISDSQFFDPKSDDA